MKESFLKVGGLFLPLTSPVLVTFTRFLACNFRKFWPTSALKRFCYCSYIFGIITHLLMEKSFPLLALKHTSKHNSWGMNGTKYWRLLIVEYLQPNKFKDKPSFNPIYQFSCFSSLGDASCFHVLPGKGRLSLSTQWKQIMFLGKNTIFPDYTGRIMCRHCPF